MTLPIMVLSIAIRGVPNSSDMIIIHSIHPVGYLYFWRSEGLSTIWCEGHHLESFGDRHILPCSAWYPA